MRLLFSLVVVSVLATTVRADDAYLVRFDAQGRSGRCGDALWAGDALFYNNTSAPLTVRFLGLSNGTPRAETSQELVVPAHRTRSLARAYFEGIQWVPTEVPEMWVVHVDVPPGITIESRDEVYYRPLCAPLPEEQRRPAGKVSLPVFRHLMSASQPQVLVGTDLGGLQGRMNVGVYNAGTVPAAAHIEVRNACDDALVDVRDVTIAPNTIMQLSGFRLFASECTTNDTANWVRNTVVTVDQPSFAYVSGLAIDAPPVEAVPAVGLTVPITVQY